MILDAWLPVGFELPDGDQAKRAVSGGINWQIIETKKGNFALISRDSLHQKWFETELLEPGAVKEFTFGSNIYGYLISDKSHILRPVSDAKSPNTVADAMSFSLALKGTRELDKSSPLQDSIYVEKYNRLLPTYSITTNTSDDIILGYWLTGGALVSATGFRRLQQMTGWRDPSSLKKIVESAGFEINELIPNTPSSLSNDTILTKTSDTKSSEETRNRTFSLPGRPDLELFFNEHVIDILQNHERYKSLGIEFPSAIALYGPPGCGKTFAVDRLVELLGWPSYEINSSSVASPYIHDTSKKIAEVFDNAIENAPSVLIIDEMEAFLADREMGSGHHRVEEVAEFLRRIPDAAKNKVLIIAMTNRIEIIDPAILRRGRFDHIIKVDFASEIEVKSLLDKLLSSLPKVNDVDTNILAEKLSGRPLSDVTFVVREAARLAAKSGKSKLDQESLKYALDQAPARDREGSEPRRIGFI